MKIKLGLHMCGWGNRPVLAVLEQDASPDSFATSKASCQHMHTEIGRITS